MSDEMPDDLAVEELAIINAIITKATQKGIFEPTEFKTVGHIYERVQSMIDFYNKQLERAKIAIKESEPK